MKRASWMTESAWPVVLATLLCLLPFVNKAFHIDDTLFLWAARQIHSHPFDFYGFDANWYGHVMPMAEINQNPPLVAYYIALVTILFGWQEWVLHLAFLLPALGVSIGTYVLAKEFCQRPLLAALSAIATPVFLVSATNVMSDILMLAFYLWAVIFWIRGVEQNRFRWLVIAAALVTLSALTKYFGLTAAPLLLVYTVARLKAFDRRLLVVLVLALPLLLLFGYQQWTNAMYGRGLLSAAASYSMELATRDWSKLVDKSLSGLAFTGGCVASVFFFAPWLWAKRAWLIGGIAAGVLVMTLVVFKGSLFKLDFVADGGYRWGIILQTTLFVVAGLHLLLLAGHEWYRQRDAAGCLLFCWVVGTFSFSAFFNWTINGRTLLPMLPAVAILLARRLDRLAIPGPAVGQYLPLVPALLLALTIGWADYALADSQRRAAATITRELQPFGRQIWFQGHWGFQYYMEQHGAKAVDIENPAMQPGEFLVLPDNNTNIYTPDYYIPRQSVALMQTYRFPAGTWVASMRQEPVGAGFYASKWGPLPYVFGPVPMEDYWLFRRIN